MTKITKLKRPAMLDFCAACLDEIKCHDAGKCLMEAQHAEWRAEPAEMLALPEKPLREDAESESPEGE